MRDIRLGRLLAALLAFAALCIFIYSQIRPFILEPEQLLVVNRGFLFALLFAALAACALAWIPQPAHDFDTHAQESSELRRQRATVQAVLDGSPAGIVLVADDGRVLLSNTRMQSLFALSEDEQAADTLAHLLRQYQFIEAWHKAVQSGAGQVLVAEVPQSRRTLRASVLPLGGALGGELSGHSVIAFEDVTELHRLETVRKDFVSNVSHELRTPLTSLRLLTESLRGGAIHDPPAAERFLALMETELDALSTLVTELLELARTESQNVKLLLAATDGCALLQAAAGRLRVQAERAGLQLRVDCPPGLPSVLADAPRIEQVLVNLIHNATKFTPAGGSIQVSAAAKDGLVEFSVQDSGVGIESEDQARIFERFYKTDPARNRTGTGLGLAIARHVVEAHGGHIGVSSQPGKGSRFFFTLRRVVGEEKNL
ncbi:MAG: PAS domain-containing protein [Anaerolineales bacterium]|nr:PAS domain-containing protein [Anaerolineales bacterium]